VSCHAQSKRERPRVEVNSSDVLDIVGPERTVQELAAVSDENSRRKLHNVVVNSSAKFGNLNGSLLHLATFSGDADAYVDIVLDAPVLGAGAFVGLFAGHS